MTGASFSRSKAFNQELKNSRDASCNALKSVLQFYLFAADKLSAPGAGELSGNCSLKINSR
jgi:hypothetical protein